MAYIVILYMVIDKYNITIDKLLKMANNRLGGVNNNGSQNKHTQRLYGS